ncbi:hypothetical protein HDV05_003234, partial [Chytridiales sp. JEL 0842]
SEKENEVLQEELVEKLVSCEDLVVFINLLKKGLTRNKTSVRIASTASPAFPTLLSKLVDITDPSVDPLTAIPKRLAKLSVLLLARSPPTDLHPEGKEIYNYGYPINFIDTDRFKAVWDLFGKSDKWEALLDTYNRNRKHKYRDLPNRNGHSNEKPSFWALGYRTLEEMERQVPKEVWVEYCKTHTNCCFEFSHKPRR